MDIAQRLEQAELEFVNIYGGLPNEVSYETKSALYCLVKLEDMIMTAPAISAGYASYQSASAGLAAIKSRDNFSVGFETRFQRPFGGSGYDSDEALGLVARRTLFGADTLELEIDQADAQVEARLQDLRNTYKLGKKTVEASYKSISAMDKAMLLAVDNAENLREEIRYLRKQLIIGQSSLDSVLSAEARLYDAESKEINFIGDKRIAELTILRALGLLSKAFSIK